MITISSLGIMGRWGNQIGQYITGKALARKYNCELQIPENWVGRKIFDIKDPVLSTSLPPTPLDVLPERNFCDLFGYYQFQEAADLYTRKDCKEWLKLRPEIQAAIDPLLIYNCCHFRRGDYVNHPCYCTVSEASYKKCMVDNGFDPATFFIVSDAHPNPSNIAGEPWLADFLILMHATVLLRANSTFSYWAAVLSPTLKRVFSPKVEALTGEHDVPFVEGNFCRCTDASLHSTGSRISDLHLKES